MYICIFIANLCCSTQCHDVTTTASVAQLIAPRYALPGYVIGESGFEAQAG